MVIQELAEGFNLQLVSVAWDGVISENWAGSLLQSVRWPALIMLLYVPYTEIAKIKFYKEAVNES